MTQGSSDPQNLVASIMGFKKEISMAATKHGLSMEGHAKVMYAKVAKKTHLFLLRLISKLHVSAMAQDCVIKMPLWHTSPGTFKMETLGWRFSFKEISILLPNSRANGRSSIYKYCDLFVYTA